MFGGVVLEKEPGFTPDREVSDRETGVVVITRRPTARCYAQGFGQIEPLRGCDGITRFENAADESTRRDVTIGVAALLYKMGAGVGVTEMEISQRAPCRVIELRRPVSPLSRGYGDGDESLTRDWRAVGTRDVGHGRPPARGERPAKAAEIQRRACFGMLRRSLHLVSVPRTGAFRNLFY